MTNYIILMTRAVQRLLYPTGQKSIADTMILMPEELRHALLPIFSFDIGGCNELEWDYIFKSFQAFYGEVQKENICGIQIWRPEEEFFLYGLTPIDKAHETIDFIHDQLKERPEIQTVVHVGLKRAVENHDGGKSDEQHVCDRDALGWIDLDGPSMIFLDFIACTRMARLFGTDFFKIPVINENLNFVPQIGTVREEGIAQMTRLAKAWDASIVTRWNDQKLEVLPSGACNITDIAPEPAPI